jgi:hypothetical protein
MDTLLYVLRPFPLLSETFVLFSNQVDARERDLKA